MMFRYQKRGFFTCGKGVFYKANDLSSLSVPQVISIYWANDPKIAGCYLYPKNKRLFVERDLVVLRHFQQLVQANNVPLGNAAKLIIDRFGNGPFEERTDIVRKEEKEEHRDSKRYEEVIQQLLDHIDKQEKFNQELLKRLEQQQKYIEE
jgi:hypothetical protein